MPKFRKKPVVIEAIQLLENNKRDVFRFIPIDKVAYEMWGEGIAINTLEGIMQARWGDWIIKGVRGEFYAIKEDIFEETYESMENKDV